jgi:F-type H+-transporting ATPase subunit delta
LQGVITINVEPGKEEKYFVAAGFAIVEPESKMTISAVEAAPLTDLDAGAARRYC